jgi:allophanate hydrolase
MARASFIVSMAGPLVTIQDPGRPRLMRFGVPASGPMDPGSFTIANIALGNAVAVPAIEVSLGGLALECVEGSVSFAVAGGGFRVSMDQLSLTSWHIDNVRAGSRLIIKPGVWGSWTYLAFAGELQCKRWLGSASTHAPSGLGGGRLAVGQRLTVENAQRRYRHGGEIACPEWACPRDPIRVVLGPQDRYFARADIDALLSGEFVLTDAYDRMGARLSGPSLRPTVALDIPSAPIVGGSIQVSGDGVSTVLLADHQTTGGYPRIATIISDDLGGFAQLRARCRVMFESLTPEAAVQTTRKWRHDRQQFIVACKERGGL